MILAQPCQDCGVWRTDAVIVEHIAQNTGPGVLRYACPDHARERAHWVGAPDWLRKKFGVQDSAAREGERRVCGTCLDLPPAYREVARVTPEDLPPAEIEEVRTRLRCTLSAAHAGNHHAVTRALPASYGADVWTSWPRDGEKATGVITLPDCPARRRSRPDDQCLLFADHSGNHSWHL